MRYKKEIWEYYIRYKDEEKLINFKKNKGRENVKAFYDMEDETFFRLLNTFSWLTKYSYKHMKIERVITKPTNNDILEALDEMKEEGLQLSTAYKEYPNDGTKDYLRKKSKKLLECVDYYIQLINEDFFIDKDVSNM